MTACKVELMFGLIYVGVSEAHWFAKCATCECSAKKLYIYYAVFLQCLLSGVECAVFYYST